MNKKRILIADDDINIIASLKYLLSDLGYDIVAVTTPQAALELSLIHISEPTRPY